MESFRLATSGPKSLSALHLRHGFTKQRRRYQLSQELGGVRREGKRLGNLAHFTVAATGVTEVPEIDGFVEKTTETLKFSADLIKQAIDLLIKGEKVLEKALPIVTRAIDATTPFAEGVTKSAAGISSTAITAATPVVKDAVRAASEALSDQGVDVSDVQATTGTVVKTASEVATPALKASIDFLTTTDPVLLGYNTVAALAVYFFGPAVLSFLTAYARGYAGDITAAGALDCVLNKGNAFLIDIRTSIEKERSGLLDLPGNVAGQLIEVEFAFTENRKLRVRLTNPEEVESRITALQIAALRRLSRSSDVYLLDTNGSLSRRVAKQLNILGFRKCFVVDGGYSGWLRSKLQTKPSPSVYRPEVVSPARVLGTVFGGTVQRKVPTTNRKALPPGK